MLLSLLQSNALLLFAMFILGQALSNLAKAGSAARANTNPLKTRREYLWLFWDIIVYRGIIALMIFWFWCSNPGAFTKAAQWVGLSWNLDVPVIPPIAFAAGLLADVVLEIVFSKIPSLRIDLPKLPAHDAPAAGGAR